MYRCISIFILILFSFFLIKLFFKKPSCKNIIYENFEDDFLTNDSLKSYDYDYISEKFDLLLPEYANADIKDYGIDFLNNIFNTYRKLEEKHKNSIIYKTATGHTLVTNHDIFTILQKGNLFDYNKFKEKSINSSSVNEFYPNDDDTSYIMDKNNNDVSELKSNNGINLSPDISINKIFFKMNCVIYLKEHNTIKDVYLRIQLIFCNLHGKNIVFFKIYEVVKLTDQFLTYNSNVEYLYKGINDEVITEFNIVTVPNMDFNFLKNQINIIKNLNGYDFAKIVYYNTSNSNYLTCDVSHDDKDLKFKILDVYVDNLNIYENKIFNFTDNVNKKTIESFAHRIYNQMGLPSPIFIYEILTNEAKGISFDINGSLIDSTYVSKISIAINTNDIINNEVLKNGYFINVDKFLVEILESDDVIDNQIYARNNDLSNDYIIELLKSKNINLIQHVHKQKLFAMYYKFYIIIGRIILIELDDFKYSDGSGDQSTKKIIPIIYFDDVSPFKINATTKLINYIEFTENNTFDIPTYTELNINEEISNNFKFDSVKSFVDIFRNTDNLFNTYIHDENEKQARISINQQSYNVPYTLGIKKLNYIINNNLLNSEKMSWFYDSNSIGTSDLYKDYAYNFCLNTKYVLGMDDEYYGPLFIYELIDEAVGGRNFNGFRYKNDEVIPFTINENLANEIDIVYNVGIEEPSIINFIKYGNLINEDSLASNSLDVSKFTINRSVNNDIKQKIRYILLLNNITNVFDVIASKKIELFYKNFKKEADIYIVKLKNIYDSYDEYSPEFNYIYIIYSSKIYENVSQDTLNELVRYIDNGLEKFSNWYEVHIEDVSQYWIEPYISEDKKQMIIDFYNTPYDNAEYKLSLTLSHEQPDDLSQYLTDSESAANNTSQICNFDYAPLTINLDETENKKVTFALENCSDNTILKYKIFKRDIEGFDNLIIKSKQNKIIEHLASEGDFSSGADQDAEYFDGADQGTGGSSSILPVNKEEQIDIVIKVKPLDLNGLAPTEFNNEEQPSGKQRYIISIVKFKNGKYLPFFTKVK